MLTRACGSACVIYTDMCELSVNQYAYIMFMLCYNIWIVWYQLWYDVFKDMFEIGYEKDAQNEM